MILREVHLHYRSGTSDKVYVGRIEKRPDGFFGVPCEYGRRGSTLRPADKGIYRTALEADVALNAVLSEKMGKGYSMTSDTGLIKNKAEKVPVEVVEVVEVVSSTESKECGESAREKALARLKASSVW